MYNHLYMLENINSAINNEERTGRINEIRSQQRFEQSTAGDGYDMTTMNQVLPTFPNNELIRSNAEDLKSGEHHIIITRMDKAALDIMSTLRHKFFSTDEDVTDFDFRQMYFPFEEGECLPFEEEVLDAIQKFGPKFTVKREGRVEKIAQYRFEQIPLERTNSEEAV
jgi:hypothetical protein